ncbi:MAG: hypothetical protein CM15mP74_32230 [Halieaceae bacterium]|nr:MAG: hypothetical protein CM15mP74_32230 [Halieaceae bacterium]
MLVTEYARSLLGVGIATHDALGVNPYQFGLIGRLIHILRFPPQTLGITWEVRGLRAVNRENQSADGRPMVQRNFVFVGLCRGMG